jgi:hypothetical protein
VLLQQVGVAGPSCCLEWLHCSQRARCCCCINGLAALPELPRCAPLCLPRRRGMDLLVLLLLGAAALQLLLLV